MIKKLIRLVCCFLLVLPSALAQNTLYQASLDTVPTDGFYKINISPQIAGYLKNDLSDIRLYDRSAKEVPYILQRE